MYPVSLKYVPGAGRAFLRAVCGADELSVASSNAADAIRLLDRLLVEVSGGDVGPGKAGQLPVPERDFLLAAVYQQEYGSRIDSTVRCRRCDEPFDLDFSLPDLIGHLRSQNGDGSVRYQADGTFRTDADLHFRLPTGEDEYAVQELPPEAARAELMQRCLLSAQTAPAAETIEAAMEKAAPLLETELAALCPECGHQQELFFSMQSFLLNAILQERRLLLREVHQIAMAYKWSHQEILALPRKLRKSYVNLIDAELDRM